MKQLISIIEKLSNWKTLIILIGVYGIFVLFVMPLMIETSRAAGGPLDLLFSYNQQTVLAHISALRSEQRSTLAFQSLVYDTAYPLVYTALFMVTIMMLVRALAASLNKESQRSKLVWLALIPLAAMGFDLCENIYIRSMLASFPELPQAVVARASLFTSLKWIAVGVNTVIIIALTIVLIGRKVRMR